MPASEHLRRLEALGWVEVGIHRSGLPQVSVTELGYRRLTEGRWLP